MISLPAKNTDAGLETRLLMAECRGPSSSTYNVTTAKECMQLMDVVLWNRLKHPALFNARGATTLPQIVKAPGQFAGFGRYPDYDEKIRARLQAMVDIANNPKDSRHTAFIDFVNAAIAVAQDQTIADPSSAGMSLVAWRTGGAASPGANFALLKSVFGVDFYAISTPP